MGKATEGRGMRGGQEREMLCYSAACEDGAAAADSFRKLPRSPANTECNPPKLECIV